VLVADDDDNDILFLQQAFLEAQVLNPIQAVHGGLEAIQYLKGEGVYADRQKYPLPSLMLLDLKMPGCDGFEVLKWLSARRNVYRFPIVVLSSSSELRDTQRAMELGASAYSVKPCGLAYLVEMAKELKTRWLEPIVPRRRVIHEV
jgi:CheY-like chemotaxis protein